MEAALWLLLGWGGVGAAGRTAGARSGAYNRFSAARRLCMGRDCQRRAVGIRRGIRGLALAATPHVFTVSGPDLCAGRRRRPGSPRLPARGGIFSFDEARFPKWRLTPLTYDLKVGDGCGSPAPVGGLKSYFDALRARARSCSGFPWSHSVSQGRPTPADDLLAPE